MTGEILSVMFAGAVFGVLAYVAGRTWKARYDKSVMDYAKWQTRSGKRL